MPCLDSRRNQGNSQSEYPQGRSDIFAARSEGGGQIVRITGASNESFLENELILRATFETRSLHQKRESDSHTKGRPQLQSNSKACRNETRFGEKKIGRGQRIRAAKKEIGRRLAVKACQDACPKFKSPSQSQIVSQRGDRV